MQDTEYYEGFLGLSKVLVDADSSHVHESDQRAVGGIWNAASTTTGVRNVPLPRAGKRIEHFETLFQWP